MAHCLSEEKDARQHTVNNVSRVISHLLLPEGDPPQWQLMEYQRNLQREDLLCLALKWCH